MNTPLEPTGVYLGHVSAYACAAELIAFLHNEPNRGVHLERATDELIKTANAMGCTVKKAPAHLVLMQKTETKIAEALDKHADEIRSKAARAEHLERKLAMAEATILELQDRLERAEARRERVAA